MMGLRNGIGVCGYAHVCRCVHITSAAAAKSSCGRLLAGLEVRGRASEGIVPLKGYLGLGLAQWCDFSL